MRVKNFPSPSFNPDVRDGGQASIHGHVYFYKDGRYHREDGPAVIYSYGEERWYYEGFLHRIGGPSIIAETGNYYFINGNEFSRDDYNFLMFTLYNKKVN